MNAGPASGAWAIRPCIYGGRRLERGELFDLAGLPTDDRLIDEHYVQRLLPKHKRYDCPVCGKTFVGEENFHIHGRRAHGKAPVA